MQDDARQAALANQIVESLTMDEPDFVPLVAAIELVWVLSSSFELVRSQVVQLLGVLLQAKELQMENSEVVWRAVRLDLASEAAFADCLIERSAVGCSQTLSFDRDAVKNCAMTLLQ